MLEVYDPQTGLLKIGPFHYGPMRSASIMLQESDDFILQHLSSSPEVEPAHVVEDVSLIKIDKVFFAFLIFQFFLQQIKSTLKLIQDHPFPEITIFHDGQPRFYRKDEHGQWVQVRLNPFRYEQDSLN